MVTFRSAIGSHSEISGFKSGRPTVTSKGFDQEAISLSDSERKTPVTDGKSAHPVTVGNPFALNK